MIPSSFALHFPLLTLAASAALDEGFAGIQAGRDGSVLAKGFGASGRVRWAPGRALANCRKGAEKRTLSLVRGHAKDRARPSEPIAA